jgi:hypothetical protein
MITAVSTRPKKQYRSICSRIPRSIALAPHPPCEPAHIGCTLVSNRLATRRNKAVSRLLATGAVKRGDCAPVRPRGRFGIHVVERAPELQLDQLRPRDLADRAGRDMRPARSSTICACPVRCTTSLWSRRVAASFDERASNFAAWRQRNTRICDSVTCWHRRPQVGGFTGFRFRNRPGPLAAKAAKAAGGHNRVSHPWLYASVP